jgi:signal transduction histidine kinase
MSSSAWVRSDPVLLERIVLNLVSNAVRYTTSGGIVVGCRRCGSMLRIEVADSGPGIPEDQQRKIFSEFYRIADTAKTNQAGLGLGLAIVERLCGLLDHPIELSSTRAARSHHRGLSSQRRKIRHHRNCKTSRGLRGGPGLCDEQRHCA